MMLVMNESELFGTYMDWESVGLACVLLRPRCKGVTEKSKHKFGWCE